MSRFQFNYDIKSKHIQDILNNYILINGGDIDLLEKEVLEKVIKREKMLREESDFIYKDMINQSIEEVVFEEYLITKNMINKNTILELVDFLKLRHPSLLPLKDGYTKKLIYQLTLFFVPTKFETLPTSFQEVETASASNKGEIILNTDFINKLLTWGDYKEVKGYGSWYDIPEKNKYTYVEFIILHECFHILNGDLYKMSKKVSEVKLNNYMCDFINNYNLLNFYDKKGKFLDYLLPTGLWSTNVNFENQKRKSQIKDLLNSEIGDNFENQPENFDTHNNEEINSSFQDNEEKEKENGIEEELIEKLNEEVPENNNNEIYGEKKGNLKFDRSNLTFKPKYNWQHVLNKMFSHTSEEPYETYSKINKRGISSMNFIEENGIGAIKPGYIEDEKSKKNILFILDNSGSVWSELKKNHIEILNLIKEYKNQINKFYIIRFDTKYKLYEFNIDKNIIYSFKQNDRVKLRKLNEKRETIGSFEKFFSDSTWGGGTVFSEKMSDLILKLNKEENFNIICFSDLDILQEENKVNFNKMSVRIKHNTTLSFITTLERHCCKIKRVLKNIKLLTSFS